MFENPYYNGIIKQIVVGFGSLFSNIKIVRHDQSGNLIQTISVPIAYAPKEKWLVRTEQDPNLENNVFATLPRMGFEVTGYSYDSNRKVNRNHYVNFKDGNTNTRMHAPAPYNIEISLYAVTKGTEDGLCIVEQILPLFTPEYSLNFEAIPSMGIKESVPLVLNSVSVSDEFEGDFQTKRLVTHTFNFTAKANIYGSPQSNKVITTVDVDVDTKTINAGENKYTATGNPVTQTVTSEGWST
jgi:hypothetical protein